MRIGLAGHGVGQAWDAARVQRRPPAGKARHRQVEAAPEEVNGADFAEEARPESRKHAMRGKQDAPEAIGEIAIVGGVEAVPAEGDAAGDLAGQRVDRRVEPEFGERRHHLTVELGHRFRREHDLAGMVVARLHPKEVIDEIEIDLEGAVAGGHRRGRQAASGHVERHVPGVVEPGLARQADLADDLGPQMQRLVGRLPRRIRQVGPALGD